MSLSFLFSFFQVNKKNLFRRKEIKEVLTSLCKHEPVSNTINQVKRKPKEYWNVSCTSCFLFFILTRMLLSASIFIKYMPFFKGMKIYKHILDPRSFLFVMYWINLNIPGAWHENNQDISSLSSHFSEFILVYLKWAVVIFCFKAGNYFAVLVCKQVFYIAYTVQYTI